MVKMSDQMSGLKKPLCIDLDGTLIRTDMLWESLIALIRIQPIALLLLPLWLLRGKAYFKQQLAKRVIIDVSLLPYRESLLTYIRQESEKGREIVLATATHHTAAQQVADFLDCFDRVVATDDGSNLSGENKARVLIDLYGEGGYEYAGNATADLKVWKYAGAATVVTSSVAFLRRVKSVVKVKKALVEKGTLCSALFREVRPHQWVKNLLVFVPLIAAHQIGDLALLGQAVLAFVAFSLCASSVYLFNDLIDMESDRAHSRKCGRPFASGELAIPAGLGFVVVLFLASGAVALLLPVKFQMALLAYYLLSVLYSLTLKSRLLVDVFCLAMLYTFRVVAGGFAVGVVLSHWLLAFSMFLFLSLAFIKRYAELLEMEKQGKLSAKGRDYVPSDMNHLAIQGVGSGYLASLILALYVSSGDVIGLYHHYDFLWALPPLYLYWINRLWMVTQRGEMHYDPVVFAIRDKISYFVLFIGALAMWLAI